MKRFTLNPSLAILIIATIVLSTTLPGFVFAQQEMRNDLIALINKNASWDPPQFLLNKLRTNRLVLIGDDGHGDPLFFKVVISSLNGWATAWEKNSSKDEIKGLPKHLILFLEEDTSSISQFNRYVRSGNPIDLIEPSNFEGFQFTTSTLEFYYDLKTFRLRVDEFNRTHDKNSQIMFDIVGPEKHIDISNWSFAKRDSFFVFERDEYSSSKIIQTMNTFPDAKAFIYYGDGHLVRGKVLKQKGKPEGYFMASYLTDSLASKGGVYTCNQVDVAETPWVDPTVIRIGKNFAIDNSVFAGSAINRFANFAWRDGSIFEFAPQRLPRHISTVLSENFVNFVLDHFDTLRSDTSKEFYKADMNIILRYLSTYDVVDMHIHNRTLPGIDSAISSWKEWRKTSHLNIVEDIASLNFFKRYVERIRLSSENLSTAYLNQLLPIIGFKVFFVDGTTQQAKADNLWNAIQKYRKPVIIQNMINILWVGTETEIQQALKVLSKETGQEFKTAKEWTTWWEKEQNGSELGR